MCEPVGGAMLFEDVGVEDACGWCVGVDGERGTVCVCDTVLSVTLCVFVTLY